MMRWVRWLLLAGLIVVLLRGKSSPAGAAMVFHDSFEGRAPGASLVGAYPEVGDGSWTVSGVGTLVAVSDGAGVAMDVRASFDAGLAPVGPAMGAERWIRLDIPSESKGALVITPQLQTGAETDVRGLPAVWPSTSGADAWAEVNTTFAQGGGGTSRPARLNLATLYPGCNRDIPFHVEIRWKINAPDIAEMAVRIWNGEEPPPFTPGAAVTYTLASGEWRLPARSAVSRVGSPALLASVSVYDGAPEPIIIPASDAAFSYSGRWSAFGAEMHAAGAGQRVRFLAAGNSCTLLFRTAADSLLPISYRVDGGPWTRAALPAGPSVEVPIYEGQSWGPHSVEMMVSSMTGPFWTRDDTRLVFAGARLPAGGSVGSLPWPSQKAVFLGDSISCGWLVLSATTGQSANPQSDARLAPAALLADWLGWDTANVSVPGIGFLRPYPGESEPLVAQTFLDQMFSGIPWPSPAGVSKVVINLGTNDYDSTKYPDAMFRRAVTAYLGDVRAKFPAARIYLLTPFNGSRAGALRAAFDETADPNSEWVDTRGGSPGGAWLNRTLGIDTTDGLHPNQCGNVKIARRLVTLLGADGPPAARFDQPASGAAVSGRVAIWGSAHGTDFTEARLEVGVGASPATWSLLRTIQTPLAKSLLAVWDTRALPPGPYTLRLRTTANGETADAAVTVTVNPPGDVDGDHAGTMLDAALALRTAGGLNALPGDRFIIADAYPLPGYGARVAGDGYVDIRDALTIVRAVMSPMENRPVARVH